MGRGRKSGIIILSGVSHHYCHTIRPSEFTITIPIILIPLHISMKGVYVSVTAVNFLLYHTIKSYLWVKTFTKHFFHYTGDKEQHLLGHPSLSPLHILNKEPHSLTWLFSEELVVLHYKIAVHGQKYIPKKS